MREQQTQQLVNDFNRWVAEQFLPEEERLEKGSAEWEDHLNRLTTMVAEFFFGGPETTALEVTDPRPVIHAFGEFVAQRLGTPPLRPGAQEPSPDHSYYMWPFCMYFGSKHSAASLN